jgi:hypothetical protein
MGIPIYHWLVISIEIIYFTNFSVAYITIINIIIKHLELTFTFVASFTLVNMLDDNVTKVWDSFWNTYYYHIPKIYHFLSYVIMACQWINFRHQTKQVPLVFHANSLGNENPMANKTFDCCISTCRNSYYVSFMCESIYPSMPFWVEVQQCLLDLF